MSDEAYLIATRKTGKIKSDPDNPPFAWKEVVANSPVAIPVGWLAFFAMDDLVNQDTSPLFVAAMPDAIKRFQSRKKSILKAFPDYEAALDDLVLLIETRKAKRLVLDFAELWAMEPDSFLKELKSGLSWFNQPRAKNWESLLTIANVTGYDQSSKTFAELHPDVPREFHLVGYEYELSSDDPEDNRSGKSLVLNLDMSRLKKLAKKLQQALPKDSGFQVDQMMLDKFNFLDMGFVETISGTIDVTLNKKAETLTTEYQKNGKQYQVRLGGSPAILEVLNKVVKAM